MRERLSWRMFLLLQPVLVCFTFMIWHVVSDAQSRMAIGRVEPQGPLTWLSVLFLGVGVVLVCLPALMLHVLLKNRLKTSVEVITLLFAVPVVASALLYLLCAIIFRNFDLAPAG